MEMSYQVLARKWRPQTFNEMVGQRHVVVALRNALSSGRLHHAYLFSGTRGVGKTSIARLLAKGLNCVTGITDQPCGTCSHCQQIEQGRFVDLIEIDAASRTKVEDIRDILDNVQYMPSQGRFKVYLIDEVHMLSRSSFNALLKTLEEPPAHVKFLFATTDAQKLPITILSRCLHFHLRPLSEPQIQQQLNDILASESIVFQHRATAVLARAAEGSMRDALSLADQAIALGAGVIEYDSVVDMLGIPDRTLALNIIEALLDGTSHALFAQLKGVAERGGDWDLLLVEVLTILHQVAMLQLAPDYPINETHQQQLLSQLAKRVAPVDLQLYYQIISQGRAQLSYAPNIMMGVEMLFLRALAFHPLVSVESVIPQVSPVTTPLDIAPALAATLQHTTAAVNTPDRLLASSHATTNVATTTAVKATPSESNELRGTASVMATQVELGNTLDSVTSRTSQLLKARARIKQQGETPPIKKSEALSRCTSKTPERTLKSRAQSEPSKVVKELEEIADDYRWESSELFEEPTVEYSVNQLKEQVDQRSPELIEKIRQESLAQDSWSQLIEQLTLPRLTQQILLNAYCTNVDCDRLALYVRSSHWYLVTDNSRQIISEAFLKLKGEPVQIDWAEDNTTTQLTPLEWREAIYQQKLAQAKKDIQQNTLVQLICNKFAAEIDEQSIQPI